MNVMIEISFPPEMKFQQSYACNDDAIENQSWFQKNKKRLINQAAFA